MKKHLAKSTAKMGRGQKHRSAYMKVGSDEAITSFMEATCNGEWRMKENRL